MAGPALGHLPVRILWTQANGDVVDQRLASHTPENTAFPTYPTATGCWQSAHGLSTADKMNPLS